MGKRYTINHEVAYYECDINQTMTFPALLSVAIKSSTDQSDELERGTEYINKLGFTWVITQTEVQISRLPQVGEKITIVTEPTEFNRYFCYRSYWVYDAAGNELLKIDMSFVLMDIENRKMSSVDAALMAPYESPKVKKIRRWPKIEKVESGQKELYHVRYYDLDSNHHVNNAMYFNWLIDVLGYDFMTKHMPTYVNVKFDKEVLYGNDIESFYEIIEGTDVKTRHEIRLGDQLACEANILWQKRS
ncbi:acyl-[acyl-carrier-protein] thioesterase [Enterococcus dongliensis]|uniref:acyl-[acyl-carrier-protein] thioesterase n=1 Tax=Enterococcus dongliensis TaxID=2559925 RepID=UPI00289257EA|nr:acyl-ACP thioesterase domain-containing protein [Enterococcus dongliensis]MDT2603674.1 thioesterase [Enterococcus dongliensis]MDT2644442.1 thioesterase [Enterococcus dongliensis]MDT2672454.1 thioesterase [Enterococcus dongliensis]MDT2711130.1 thioesterase [Enterococcus dongliensis]